MYRQDPTPLPATSQRSPAPRARGFSLVELLIVIAIVAIIASIALPSYLAYVTKTRRTDATIFLTEAAGEQVRFFSEFNSYTDKMTELGYAADSAVTTPEGYYQVTATVTATGNAFTLTATPVTGEAQAGDTVCTSFTLSSTGAQGASSADCW